MKTSFTIPDVLELWKQYAAVKGGLYHDWFYRSKSAEFVNNYTYEYIYNYFKDNGVDVSQYQPPVKQSLPIVDKSFVEGKKSSFTTADITRILYSTQGFKKWDASQMLTHTAGINFLDYRTTYNYLKSVGADLSEYLEPDVLMLVKSGATVKETQSTIVQSETAVVDYKLFFVLLFGLLCLYWFSND